MKVFAKAVAVGTIVAAAVPCCLTIPAALLALTDPGDWRSDDLHPALLVTLPIVASFVVVLFACLVIGLPTSFVLRRMRRESEGAYVPAGGVAGLLLPLVAAFALRFDSSTPWFCAIGLASGAMAASPRRQDVRGAIPTLKAPRAHCGGIRSCF